MDYQAKAQQLKARAQAMPATEAGQEARGFLERTVARLEMLARLKLKREPTANRKPS